MKEKSKEHLASESLKTKRAREKLSKQWKKQDLLITQSALVETIEKIHQWIAANAMHRLPLKEKSIRLFDQNQNAADLSIKVRQFAQKMNAQLDELSSS